ncbi:hypothetical protein [Ruegeria sp. Ofav3-42]|uniref:hypothetical protein n=1 Tax=Ruegeria sp. Ofav3-42 TaxID=2917759 RepID=UPI001EF592F2|nr:hypothetical protein [Ruegeria sp. Ofav3-42]MCG7518274.1 hypothetical protein [Ruegeria sp. Ofav3-42]
MKYLAALAALILPAAAQATTQKTPGAEFVYECQIEEICKSTKCTPTGTPKKISLKRIEGESKGTVSVDGEVVEVHVFKGLGAHEFLQITSGGSVGYTVNSKSGSLAIRATGANAHHERGTCAVN